MKNVTFEHVKGVEEAKNELQEVVEFLKNPQKFTVLGGKLPKGCNFTHSLLNIVHKLVIKYEVMSLSYLLILPYSYLV